MTLSATRDTIGARIRTRRQELKLTVAKAAALADISTSQLSRIEREERGCDNRFIIANLAKALRCSIEHLTGTYVPGAQVHAATNDTVRALVLADLDFPAGAVDLAPLAQLRQRTEQAVDLRKGCEYDGLTRMLPSLIRDLHAGVAGPDREDALRMLVRVAEAASFAVRFTGQSGAANLAADRARQAAQLLGEPVYVAFGEWARAHSALGCGLPERAVQITERAITLLAAAPEAPGRTEMLGMLYLTVAFAYVGIGRLGDAEAPLREANVLAGRTGETDWFALMFGPTNCRLWELAIFADGGDPIDALPLIADIGQSKIHLIASKSRQAAFYIDSARVLHRVGETDRAVQHMEIAERIAPQRVHGDLIVVETVAAMVDSVRRRAVSTRLAGLAQRVGANVA